MPVPKKGEGWGLVGCSKEGQVQGRLGLLGSSTGGGKGSGGVPEVTCSCRGLPRKGWLGGGSKGFGSGGGRW